MEKRRYKGKKTYQLVLEKDLMCAIKVEVAKSEKTIQDFIIEAIQNKLNNNE